jgi:asparagine synthase (glutamine-hydrolysing)
MCGILGTIPSSEYNLFKSALDTLSHRGPDDYGIENFNGEVSLGHRRLSILDISANGHQPMSDKGGRYTIVFNGEIYNFLEIKKELVQLGHSFISTSDTEVLLSAFIEWGDKCVLKFNGMWAFGIWDKEKKELFLSRDRFGQKPLFYAFVEDKFIFASEMKAICPFLKSVEPSDEFRWMRKNIMFYEATEKCLIKGVLRFPAGHNGRIRNGELNSYRYWNTLEHLVEVPKTYEEQVERFRELFMDSCMLRMRSDVPIGTALSGGLDSSATIAAMANLSSKNQSYAEDWQHAFVATFPGTPLDESEYAEMVTDHLGLKATFLEINPLKHWENIENYLYLFEDLYITSPIPMIMLYQSVKSNGVTVTLDGHGADELLSGYMQGAIESLWDARFSPKNTKDILRTIQSSMNPDTEQFSRTKSESLYFNFMSKKVLKKLAGKSIHSLDREHANYKKLDNLTQYLYAMFHENVLPTLLRNYDRYSMINGVEIRMPFMDHRVVSFVNSLPYNSKIGHGFTKRILRDAIDPYLPKQVTWRTSKIGFSSPIVNWMQNDLNEWFLDTVHSGGFLNSELVNNPESVRDEVALICHKNSSDFTKASYLWTEVSTYLWGKAFLNKNYTLK